MTSVGIYANNGTKPWLSFLTPVSKTDTNSLVKRKSKKVQPNIVHPIFDECVKTTTDPYWISIFQKASYGKFPKKFSYCNGIMQYKKGTKIESLEIDLEPVQASIEYMRFFKRCDGLMSDIDISSYTVNTVVTEMKWSKLSPRFRKILMIGFVEFNVNNYKLDKKEKLAFENMLFIGFILKDFNKDNVVLSLGKISHINGLLFEESTRSWQFKTKPKAKARKAAPATLIKKLTRAEKKNSFYFAWVKLVEHYERKTSGNSNKQLDTTDIVDTDVDCDV